MTGSFVEFGLALFVACAVIGAVAALIGIGGGLLIVPLLFVLLPTVGIPRESLMHVAAGTALCIMVATSISATWNQARARNIAWDISLRVWPGAILGTALGALLADALRSRTLEVVFGVVVAVVALTMIFGFRVSPRPRPRPGLVVYLAMSLVIGFKSGLLGVGGGALSVPWLTWLGLPQNVVSGTSNSFTLPIAVTGAVAFMLTGADAVSAPHCVGFVYWPALPIAAAAVIPATALGARWVRRVPGRALRIGFGVVLFGVSLRMVLP